MPGLDVFRAIPDVEGDGGQGIDAVEEPERRICEKCGDMWGHSRLISATAGEKVSVPKKRFDANTIKISKYYKNIKRDSINGDR